MALFEPAFSFMMDHEDAQRKGEVTQEPNGGVARWGINSVEHPDVDVRALTLDEAAVIYKADYWGPIRGYSISEQTIANKYFDLAVNTGIREATLIVQRGVDSLQGGLFLVDGQVGPLTIAAINKADPVKLLEAIKGYARQFYTDLTNREPKLAEYLSAWLTRVDA